jgi:hypothetical protein
MPAPRRESWRMPAPRRESWRMPAPRRRSRRMPASPSLLTSQNAHKNLQKMGSLLRLQMGSVLTLAVIASASSAVRFARTYGDDMVLQHGGSGASIWGYAPPGENVSVAVKSSFNGVLLGSASSEAADDGTWQAVLPPQPPGNNTHSITAVASSGDEATLARVIFGDVWVCSGQSNSEIYSPCPTYCTLILHILSQWTIQ